LQGLEAIVRDFKKQDRLVVFCGMKTRVLSIMSGVCKEKFLHAASESELSSLLRGVLSRGICHNWSEISVSDKALLKENQFY
jgi:hypothetical protein